MNGDEDVLTRSYAFPADVRVLPVTELSADVRKRIGGEDGDFAIARPRHRAPSRLVDTNTLELLREFSTPTPIGEAVVRFATKRGLDPEQVLESAFPVLQAFTASLFLVPEDSAFAESVDATFVPGQMVAEFEIRRLVRVLQDSEVYLATSRSGAEAALKVARPGAVDVVRPLLEREAFVLDRLEGAPTPGLLDVRLDEDPPFLALEWLPGVSANRRAHELRTTRGTAWRGRMHALVDSLLAAYVDLHNHGVVHGDVHSGNVLVNVDDNVRILDFGMSRVLEAGSVHNHGDRTGFSAHMEPESAGSVLHFGVGTPSTLEGEQYAVASLAYAMTCGGHYTGEVSTRDRMIERALHTPPLPFARQGFESWPAAEAVLRRALSKEPEDRFQSMADFRGAWLAALPPAPIDRAEPESTIHRRGLEHVVGLALDPNVDPRSLVPRPPRASAQYGAAGVALFLYRASLVRDSPRLLAGADRWSRHAVALADEDGAFIEPALSLTPDRVPPTSLYHGRLGVALIHLLIARARGDFSAIHEQTAEIVRLHEDSSTDATNRPTASELVFGDSGALLGCTLALEALNSLSRVDAGPLRNTMLAALERASNGLAGVAPAPTMPHLGIAHGLAGTLYVQLRARLALGLPVPQSVRDGLDHLAAQAEPSGRGVSWPGTPPGPDGTAITQERTPDHAPGWCAGTAGHVHLWTVASEALDNTSYGTLAELAAWHCWEHSERSGHLCCGLAGRGFALLQMYRHSGDTSWLERARHLSRLSEPWLEQALGDAERRFGLFWGALGSLLMGLELDEPEAAAMPLFSAEGWKIAGSAR